MYSTLNYTVLEKQRTRACMLHATRKGSIWHGSCPTVSRPAQHKVRAVGSHVAVAKKLTCPDDAKLHRCNSKLNTVGSTQAQGIQQQNNVTTTYTTASYFRSVVSSASARPIDNQIRSSSSSFFCFFASLSCEYTIDDDR